MKSKTRWTMALALLVLLPLAGGCGTTEAQETTAAAGQPAEALQPADEPYTLRIVFSGLVPLVPSDNTTSPDTLTVLVPNLSDPSKLDLGKLSHKHRGRLLFDPDQVDVDAGGRPIHTDGWVCDCPETDEPWSYLTLEGEHLTLEAPGSLDVVRGPIDRPVPCDPTQPGCDVQGRSLADQERDIQWAIQMDEIASGLVKKGRPAPRLRKDLLASVYTNPSYPLISTRFQFHAGRLETRSLIREDDECTGDYQAYTITPGKGSTSNDFVLEQTIARDLELQIAMNGPVELKARALSSGPGGQGGPKPIVLRPREGKNEVVLHIDNHPVASSCRKAWDMIQGTPGDVQELHFLTIYNLFDQLDDLPEPSLSVSAMVPKAADPPVWSGQCSPPVFSAP